MGCNPAGLSSNNMEIIPMTIRKVKGLESDFTIVPNKTINDKLSWAARGMLLYLCSKPDDWEVCISDLVNQTTGSAKRSGRDAVRKIMDELVDCGYMRKTQKRISGKFERNDYEVSFQPFTENPYTANPSTANPAQQSKDLTKKGINKVQNTDIFSGKQKETCFIDELCISDYFHCHEAMSALKAFKESGSDVYDGSLTIDEWNDCETAMRSCDEFDHVAYIEWWMERYESTFTKKPALTNMVCDMNGIEFDRFYDMTYLQECE